MVIFSIANIDACRLTLISCFFWVFLQAMVFKMTGYDVVTASGGSQNGRGNGLKINSKNDYALS